MPNYTFVCDTCGACFDMLRAVEFRDSVAECPICGASSRRQFDTCALRMPCPDWTKLTARDFLGRENKSDRVVVNVGNPKPVVR